MPAKQRARSRSSSVVVTENPLLNLPERHRGGNAAEAAKVPAQGVSAAPMGDLLQLVAEAPPAVDDELDLDAILAAAGTDGGTDRDQLDAILDGPSAADELDAILDGPSAADELDAVLAATSEASPAAEASTPAPEAKPAGPDPRLATIRKAGEDVLSGASGQADRVAPARGRRERGDATTVGVKDGTMQAVDAMGAFAGKTAEVGDLSTDGFNAFGAEALGQQAEGGGVGSKGVFAPNGSEHNILEGAAGIVGGMATLRDDGASRSQKLGARLSVAGNGTKLAGGVLTTMGEHPSGDLSGRTEALTGLGGAMGMYSDAFLGGAQAVGAYNDGVEAAEMMGADHLSTSEKVLGVGSKVSSATNNLANATASGAKVAGFLSPSASVAGTIATATGVASIAGIVTGALDLVQGAMAVSDASAKAKALDEAQQALHDGLRAVTAERAATLRQAEAFATAADDAAVTETSVAAAKALAQADLAQLDAWEAELSEASSVVGSMRGLKGAAKEDGVNKAIGGGMGVVGGALTLSGVGLPIVLSVGVAAALVKLGFAGAQWARDKKANTWIELAKGLTPDGALKTPDPTEDIGYPEMEERFIAAYYKDGAPIDKAAKPPGELGHAVWQFGRAEKVQRLGKPKDENKKDIRSLSRSERRLYWLRSDKGEEKSTGSHAWGDFFKSNVTKSSQAKEVKRHEVVDALNHIAWNTFDASGPAFRTGANVARVQLSDADKATYKMSDADFATLKSLTDDVILSTTGLKDKAGAYKAEQDSQARTHTPVEQDHMRDFVAKFVR